MDFTQFLGRVRRDEAGATAIEYGLIAALVSITAIVAMGAVGNSLSATFSYVELQESAAQNGQL